MFVLEQWVPLQVLLLAPWPVMKLKDWCSWESSLHVLGVAADVAPVGVAATVGRVARVHV